MMLKSEDEICSNTGIPFRSLRQDFMFELETHFIALTCFVYIYILFFIFILSFGGVQFTS